MLTFVLSNEAEKHLNTLYNSVKCSICSNILLTAVESSCHHVACAKCFSSQNKCPMCSSPMDPASLHPNEPLAKRSAAVLQTIKAYETFSGRNVLAKTSVDIINISDQEDSEDWFFKKDKKFSKKYEKKKRESSNSKLLSVSQNDTPIIFPGEVIDTTQGSIDSEVDKNPNAIDKVQEWLSISQVNVDAVVYKGPVRNIYPERMHENFFQKKLTNLRTSTDVKETAINSLRLTRSSTRTSNPSPSKQQNISNSSSGPSKKSNTKSENSSPTKSNKSLDIGRNSLDLIKKPTQPSTRSKTLKLQNNTIKNTDECNSPTKKDVPKHSPLKSIIVNTDESNSPMKKDVHKHSPLKSVIVNTDESNSPMKKDVAKHSPLKSLIFSKQNSINKSLGNSAIDSDTSNNYSFKANDSELKNIFTKVLQKKKLSNDYIPKREPIVVLEDCPVKNENQSMDTLKEKNPWKNVKRMKKVLNKNHRSHLKKLDISIAERNIPVIEQSDKGMSVKPETPVHIDDVISQNIVNQRCVTPEAIRRCPSEISIASSSCLNLDSTNTSKKVDKDYLACQAVIIASNKQQMFHHGSPILSISNKSMNESDSSELPLTHLSPVKNDNAKKVGEIVKKIEAEVVVSKILKDFDLESPEDESIYFTEVSDVDTSVRSTNLPKPIVDYTNRGVRLFDSFKSEDLNTRDRNHSSSIGCYQDVELSRSTRNTSVPFVYKGILNGRQSINKERRVPFYYKSRCTSKDWYKVPQDGLNIELHRDNILTSIYIRNQPFVNINQRPSDSLRIVQTRDAQTSPIPFIHGDDDFSSKNNAIPLTSYAKNINEQPANMVSYRMHPNLQRFTNCIVPSINAQQNPPSTAENKKSEHIVTHTPKKYTTYGKVQSEISKMSVILPNGSIDSQNPSISANLEASSPPLIVSEPTPDSLFDTVKKRRLPKSFSPGKHFPKKSKTTQFPMLENINVCFTSQTQMSNKGDPIPTQKAGEGNEPMNYDVIVENDMININRNLELIKDKSVPMSNKNHLSDPMNLKNNTEKEILCSEDEILFNNQEKCKISNSDMCSFVPSQRKIIEDETDLQIISMEVEPEALCTNNVFQTIPEKSNEEFIHNTEIENSKTIENLMTDVHSERQIEGTTNLKDYSESNHKSMLASPPTNDSSQVKYSENMFSTMFDKNTIGFSQDSHSSKPDAQIVSSLNLPPSMRQLRDENSKYVNKNNTSRQTERTVELSPHEQLLLTPSMKVGESLYNMRASQDLCTPVTVNDDSDDSVVEDTPQKTRKFTTVKRSVIESSLHTSDARESVEKHLERGVCSNELTEVQHVDTNKPCTKKASDTPVSISKFSDDVKVCSTPVVVCARRSLSYKDNLSAISENEEIASFTGKNSTLRRSTLHTATCMEKEFLEQAFESSIDVSNGRNSAIIECSRGIPKTQFELRKSTVPSDKNKLMTNNQTQKNICVACSCLSKAQVNVVKSLVARLGWRFTNDYVDDLTHLVVKVDENNHSQRSIKYVQALAAGKWIVSFNWIEKCISSHSLVPADDYEVLDSSGEMGPYISRTSSTKIFDGFTFYCCSPFSVISYEVLTYILKAAGGIVVDTIEEIEVSDLKKVTVLLAEPNSTEDDRFIDMVMSHRVVPINFEWVTESLGEGILCNAGNWLLVPRTLLPNVQWPINLTSDESIDIVEII